MNYEFKLLEYEATDGKDTTTYNSYAPGVDNNKFIVKMFGLNTEGKNACIFVTGFKPFFYVKVNDSWTESDVHELVAYIRTEMGKYYEDTLVKCMFVKKQKLYGFDNNKKYTFLKLKFSSHGDCGGGGELCGVGGGLELLHLRLFHRQVG